MVVTMVTLLVIGALLLLGPTVLSFFLTSLALIEPVSGFTTGFLTVALVLDISLYRMLKSINLRKAKDSKKNGKLEAKSAALEILITVVQLVSILVIILIVGHGLFVKANNGWLTVLSENEELFSTLRYIGGLFIAVGVGICMGKAVRKSNVNNDEVAYDDDKTNQHQNLPEGQTSKVEIPIRIREK